MNVIPQGLFGAKENLLFIDIYHFSLVFTIVSTGLLISAGSVSSARKNPRWWLEPLFL